MHEGQDVIDKRRADAWSDRNRREGPGGMQELGCLHCGERRVDGRTYRASNDRPAWWCVEYTCRACKGKFRVRWSWSHPHNRMEFIE
jgi:hypothetical protein